MANEAKDTKNDKPKKVTVASVFRDLAQKGAKDRAELTEKIISVLTSKGMTTNVRNFEIKKERVAQQVSAMLRDITMERGKEKNGWWSTFKVVEDANQVKIVKKA